MLRSHVFWTGAIVGIVGTLAYHHFAPASAPRAKKPLG